MKKEEPLQMVATSKKSPMDILFDKADMKCTLCEKPIGTCDYWTQCDCGWSFEKGTQCRNPDCTG